MLGQAEVVHRGRKIAFTSRHKGGQSGSLCWANVTPETDRDSAEAWTMVGRAMVEDSQAEKALQCFNEALKLNPDYQPALFARARLWVDSKQYKLAERDLALIKTRNADYHELLKRCNVALGKDVAR